MDLLFSEYASPFLLVDQFIGVRMFSEFVTESIAIRNDKELWQFFLHKVENQSFNEWKASLPGNEPDDEEIETTIAKSFNLLNTFNPEPQRSE